jgi:hypothetical protein
MGVIVMRRFVEKPHRLEVVEMDHIGPRLWRSRIA